MNILSENSWSLSALKKEFGIFLAVGGACAAVHYAVLALLVEGFGVHSTLAALAGFAAGATLGYPLNRRLTFSSDRQHAQAAPRFVMVIAVGFALTGLLMEAFARFTPFHYIAAQIITTGVVLVWHFIAHKIWTFQPETSRQTAPPHTVFNSTRMAIYALPSLLILALYYYKTYTISWPIDLQTHYIGRDFINIWMSSKAFLNNEIMNLFGFSIYNAYIKSTGMSMPIHNWSYPLHILIFTFPFGLLSYMTGYVVWVTLGLSAFVASVWKNIENRWHILWLALCPAAAMIVFTGQNGFFLAALIIIAFKNIDKKPILAGICIGILTIKPHLGVLIPLALMASGRWRVFGVAAITTIALLSISLLMVGIEAWHAYLTIGVKDQQIVMNKWGGLMLDIMPTPFMNARLMLLSPNTAWLFQIPVSIAAVISTVWLFYKSKNHELNMLFLAAISLIATPYAFTYDMLGLLGLIYIYRQHITWGWAEKITVKLLYLTPLLVVLMRSPDFKIPLSAACISLFCVLIFRQSILSSK